MSCLKKLKFQIIIDKTRKIIVLIKIDNGRKKLTSKAKNEIGKKPHNPLSS